MGRKRKEDKAYKANVSLTKLELSRLHEMASTWGVTPSRMVALLVNQVYESKAFLNGYDELTDAQRQLLLERRTYLEEIKNSKRAANYRRNYERRQGIDRGLTNVMLVLAPKHDPRSNAAGINIPGVFCERFGQLWIVPYGMLGTISPIEIMSYPCYASVSDFLTDTRIQPSQLQLFIDTNKGYLIKSEGELNILRKLYEDNGAKLVDLPLSTIVMKEIQDRIIHQLLVQLGKPIEYFVEILKEIEAGDHSRIDELPDFLKPSEKCLEAVSSFSYDEASYAALREYIQEKHKHAKHSVDDTTETSANEQSNLEHIYSAELEQFNNSRSSQIVEQIDSMDDRIDSLTDVIMNNQSALRSANTAQSIKEQTIEKLHKNYGPDIFKHDGLAFFATPYETELYKEFSRVASASQSSDSLNSSLPNPEVYQDRAFGSIKPEYDLSCALSLGAVVRRPCISDTAAKCSENEIEKRKARASSIKKALGLLIDEKDEEANSANDIDKSDRLLRQGPKPCYVKTPKASSHPAAQRALGVTRKRTNKKTMELEALIVEDGA